MPNNFFGGTLGRRKFKLKESVWSRQWQEAWSEAFEAGVSKNNSKMNLKLLVQVCNLSSEIVSPADAWQLERFTQCQWMTPSRFWKLCKEYAELSQKYVKNMSKVQWQADSWEYQGSCHFFLKSPNYPKTTLPILPKSFPKSFSFIPNIGGSIIVSPI